MLSHTVSSLIQCKTLMSFPTRLTSVRQYLSNIWYLIFEAPLTVTCSGFQLKNVSKLFSLKSSSETGTDITSIGLNSFGEIQPSLDQ